MPDKTFLKYAADLQHEHRNELGFRCTGNIDIIVRMPKGGSDYPELDLICSKCHDVLALGVIESDADASDIASLQNASRLLAERAFELEAKNTGPLNGDGKVADAMAPLAGLNPPGNVVNIGPMHHTVTSEDLDGDPALAGLKIGEKIDIHSAGGRIGELEPPAQ